MNCKQIHAPRNRSWQTSPAVYMKQTSPSRAFEDVLSIHCSYSQDLSKGERGQVLYMIKLVTGTEDCRPRLGSRELRVFSKAGRESQHVPTARKRDLQERQPLAKLRQPPSNVPEGAWLYLFWILRSDKYAIGPRSSGRTVPFARHTFDARHVLADSHCFSTCLGF